MNDTAEQKGRDLLSRMEIDGAQSFSAGEIVELANLIRDLDACVKQIALQETKINEIEALNKSIRNYADLERVKELEQQVDGIATNYTKAIAARDRKIEQLEAEAKIKDGLIETRERWIKRAMSKMNKYNGELPNE